MNRINLLFCCRLIRVHHPHPRKPSRLMWSEARNLCSLLFLLPSVYRVRARFSELMGEGRKDPMKTTAQISGPLPLYSLTASPKDINLLYYEL